MRVCLIFVPPGGGEADYQLSFELPSIPQAGDYISVLRDNEIGYETFTVRRTIWELSYPKSESAIANDSEHGKPIEVWVECEFARSPMMSDSHKRACEMYEARGKPMTEHEATAY